jgi:hypothetical protein
MGLGPFDAMLDEQYGFPDCRECGHGFELPLEECRTVVASAADLFAGLLEGRSEPKRKPAPKTWSPSGYVWHTSDWLRIQALRVYAVEHDPAWAPECWVLLDPDEIDGMFHYDLLPTASGVLALRKSVELFLAATESLDPERRFEHPSGEKFRILDIVRMVTHEIPHHGLDIRRGLGMA